MYDDDESEYWDRDFDDDSDDEVGHQVADLRRSERRPAGAGKVANDQPGRDEAGGVRESVPPHAEAAAEIDGERLDGMDDGLGEEHRLRV